MEERLAFSSCNLDEKGTIAMVNGWMIFYDKFI